MIIKNGKTFHLQGKNISYIMTQNDAGDLLHYYFGKKLSNKDYTDRIKTDVRGLVCRDENGIFLETSPQEYPAYGHTDLRTPAYVIENVCKNKVSRLFYKGYEIKENQTAKICGMPSLYAGDKKSDTLEITLEDKNIGLQVILSYTVFDDYDVVLRSTRFINTGSSPLTIEKAHSLSLDLDKNVYDLVYFPGAWLREREIERVPITKGAKYDISNARGGSGHAMNPFVMICDKHANEKNGQVYGFSLIYSGNHQTLAESDQYGNIRITQGIHPFGFAQILNPKETFYTPQSVLSYSDCGFGGLSREMHDVYRNHLCKNGWSKKSRPILINNWEATYMDFTEEKLLNLAKKAKETGIDLLVLDDGWFGKRNDDKSSLGDWYVNTEKLPKGITGLADAIHKEGLSFGLWYEPEMISENSDLYRAHPDWAISVPNIKPSYGRNQFMLDLTKKEVCDYIISVISEMLESANIQYIKWDYNRMMTDMPRPGFNHQYTLGLYRILEELTNKFPHVLFEGCASGGGRFDPGMLAYSPQIWASDNSDAIARLKIQYSTSMCYPISTISAHVTASPNHQNGRVTPLKTRGDVAYAGSFGYELDITQLPDEEIEEIKKQIKFYRSVSDLVLEGDFYRLQSPYDSNYCSWAVIAKDKSRVLLFTCRILSMANIKDKNIYLDGLLAQEEYKDTDTGILYGGNELMYKGFTPTYDNYDFSTIVKIFEKQ